MTEEMNFEFEQFERKTTDDLMKEISFNTLTQNTNNRMISSYSSSEEEEEKQPVQNLSTIVDNGVI